LRGTSVKLAKAAALGLIAVSALLHGNRADATLYCNRPYAELKRDPGRPLNAVGFLNNGCTASLIGASHILAAAHCFVDGVTGAWQTDLRFYPNFHPDRVAADARRVPRAEITRAVVASRVAASLGDGWDWGIARLGAWKDADGLDLTPLTLHRAMPSPGMALLEPAYTRHHFPYDDNDAVSWDNMERDTQHCGWVGESAPGKRDGGMWAMRMRPPPLIDGARRDRVGCNSRWMAGTIHGHCAIKQVSGDIILHNCDTIGGSSGAPLLHRAADGTWTLIGVGAGGSRGAPGARQSNDFSQRAPRCSEDRPEHHDPGLSIERFRHAPRFASKVAVARSPHSASATAVFAVDSDLRRVVWRTRQGNPPATTSRFGFWQDLATPRPGAELTGMAVCPGDAKVQPQLFVVAGNTEIHTRTVRADGQWGAWSNHGSVGAGGISDIHAINDAAGGCRLFAIAGDGALFTRAGSAATWTGWSQVAAGPYRRVTALSLGGVVLTAMLDSAGDVWRTSLGPSGWTSPVKIPRPFEMAWREIAMTRDEFGRGFMVGIPAQRPAGNALWFMPLYGEKPWSELRHFGTRLFAPNAAPQSSPEMASIAAARWMEDAAGTISPVVFATDGFGNVYFIEYARIGTPGWVLDWKSFYHETIAYK
jgi:hypothetical protein